MGTSTHTCSFIPHTWQVDLTLSEEAVQELRADPSHDDHRLSFDLCFDFATFGYPVNLPRPSDAPPLFGEGREAGADAVVLLKLLKADRQ